MHGILAHAKLSLRCGHLARNHTYRHFRLALSVLARGFYLENLPQQRELEFAAQTFFSIEINGTFYRLQLPASFERWRNERHPPSFFSIKKTRCIAHIRRPHDVKRPLANLFASKLFHLGKHLEPILWQFSPNLRYDAELLQNSCAELPKTISTAQALARRRDIPKTSTTTLTTALK